MQVTARTEYAMRSMFELARNGEKRTTAEQIAKRQCIPATMLPSIIHALARAGLVDTLRGHQGGVRLARPADQITVRQVWEAVEGPLEFHRCQRARETCPLGMGEPCRLRGLWEETRSRVLEQWEKTSLFDLASEPAGPPRARGGRRRAAR
jgi:Rrf2 family protein